MPAPVGFALNGASTTRLNAAAARIQGGTGRGVMVMGGDSTTVSQGAGTGAPYYLDDARSYRVAKVLADALTTAGVAALDGSIVTDNAVTVQRSLTAYDTRVTSIGNGFYGAETRNPSGSFYQVGSTPLTVTMAGVDTFEIIVADYGAATLNLAIDGAAPAIGTATAAMTGSGTVKRYACGVSSAGTRTLTVSKSSGGVALVTVTGYNSAVRALDIKTYAACGGKSASFAVAGTATPPDKYLGLDQLALENPDVATFCYGINDLITGVPLATTQANLTTMVNAAKVLGSTVMLVCPTAINPLAASTAAQGAMNAMIKGLASSLGVACLSLYDRFGPWNSTQWVDDYHPGRTLTASIGQAYGEVLLEMADTGAAPGTRLWTPADAATPPIFWLDAQTPASLSLASGEVVSWASRVGAGVASQASAGSRPAYSSTGFNGLPAVTFDGFSDFMSIAGKGAFPTGSSGSTMAMIGGDGGGSGDRWIFAYGGDSHTRSIGQRGATGFCTLLETTTGAIEQSAGSSFDGSGGIGVATITAGTSPTVSGIFDGGSAQSQTGTGQTGATDGGGGWIGGFAGSTFGGLHWLGPMQEILLWDAALSTADRQKLEGYLAWRWTQQGRLPSGHPYKASAPTVAEVPTVVAGQVSATLGAITALATAVALVSASVAAPLGPINASGAAATAVRASATPSLGPIAVTAAAASPVKATASVPLGPVTAASSAKVGVKAAATLSLPPITTTSATTAAVHGSATVQLAPIQVTATASGAQVTGAAANVTLGPVTAIATARAPIAGTSTIALPPVSAAGASGVLVAARVDVSIGLIATAAFARAAITASASSSIGVIACTASASSGDVLPPAVMPPASRTVSWADTAIRSTVLTDIAPRTLTIS